MVQHTVLNILPEEVLICHIRTYIFFQMSNALLEGGDML